jgi:hypothetical protein
MTVKKTAGAITGACQYQKRLVGAKSRTSGWELHGNLGQSGGIPAKKSLGRFAEPLNDRQALLAKVDKQARLFPGTGTAPMRWTRSGSKLIMNPM